MNKSGGDANMFEQGDLLTIKGIEKVETSFNGSDGGFKQVYSCVVHGQLNAVKITKVADKNGIDDMKLNRLRRELELLSALASPYLPKLGSLPVQRFEKNGSTFIIYSEEFIVGSDVCELVDGDYFREPDRVNQLLHDTATAIKIYWGHERTVHRDVKPANIRYSIDAKKFILIDAGIALVRDKTTLTPTGHGSPRTPAYTAPEVLRGDRNLSFKTDLFCLGVVAYEAATGKHPFYVDGMTSRELDDAIMNKEPQPITDFRQDLPEELVAVIMKMLRKRPHQRPNSIEVVINGGKTA